MVKKIFSQPWIHFLKVHFETKLVQINGQYIDRVWGQGDENAFKLVGIMIDEQLKWDHHIAYIAKKIGYANYSLNKARKRLTTKSKKLLYSGLIHSHLVYGAPVWGSAPKCRIDKLLKQQKKAIRNIYTPVSYTHLTLPTILRV